MTNPMYLSGLGLASRNFADHITGSFSPLLGFGRPTKAEIRDCVDQVGRHLRLVAEALNEVAREEAERESASRTVAEVGVTSKGHSAT